MSFRPTPLDYDKQKAIAIIWNGGNVAGDANFEQNISVAGTATINELDVTNGANILGGATVDTLTATGAIAGNTLEATVADGTAPLIITSTTKVDNLNVEQVDGADATSTKTASSIPISDSNGYLDSWITFNLPIRRAWFGV